MFLTTLTDFKVVLYILTSWISMQKIGLYKGCLPTFDLFLLSGQLFWKLTNIRKCVTLMHHKLSMSCHKLISFPGNFKDSLFIVIKTFKYSKTGFSGHKTTRAWNGIKIKSKVLPYCIRLNNADQAFRFFHILYYTYLRMLILKTKNRIK